MCPLKEMTDLAAKIRSVDSSGVEVIAVCLFVYRLFLLTFSCDRQQKVVTAY